MNNFECYDIDNCYVCGEYMGPFKNELTVTTGYSETTLQQIIESFLDDTNIPEIITQRGGICQNCFIKFNEYDEHVNQANLIKSQLSSMIKSRENYIEFKEEPDERKNRDVIDFAEYEESAIVDMVPTEYVLSEEYEIQVVESMKEEQILEETFVHASSPSSVIMNSLVSDKKRSGYVKKDKDQGFIVTMINNVKHYTCEFCQKHFQTRARLRSHRQIHSTERNHLCVTCGAKFKTSNCLKNHSRLHSNIYFLCDLCNSRFKGKHELRCHIDAVHLMKKDYICQICAKAFSRDKTLRQHLLYHNNERNIVCEICGFKAINRPKMARHMKTHTGQRDYSCNICGKRFLYSYNVTAHIRHVHYHEKRPSTAEEKLMCNICNKRFQKIWKVKEHMQLVHKITEETIVTSADGFGFKAEGINH